MAKADFIFKPGDRVSCHRVASAGGATGTIVRKGKRHDGWIVRFDKPNPFTGEIQEGRVGVCNIVHIDTERWPTFQERFKD